MAPRNDDAERDRQLAPAIAHCLEPVRRRGDELRSPWWLGRQWAVTAYGIQARDGTYALAADRLLEDLPGYSKVLHMAGKEWVDLEDYATAFLVACALHARPVPSEIIREHYRQALAIREAGRRLSSRTAGQRFKLYTIHELAEPIEEAPEAGASAPVPGGGAGGEP
jgi:hypothetical protein